MRFLDKVNVITGGGRDDRGNPIPEVVYGPFKATMTPIKSSESLATTGNLLMSYYRLLIEKKASEHLNSTGKVQWQGRKWSVEGDVELLVAPGGRLHHLETTVKAV